LSRVVAGRPAEWNSAIRQIKNLRYDRAVHGEIKDAEREEDNFYSLEDNFR
jgi:hypothetical protein